MRFVKMHGLCNDFVVVTEEVDEAAVRKLCDRRRGVGADGVLRVSRDGDDLVMGYWNADGSPAEMCGNGFRCVARFAFDRMGSGREFSVNTPAGKRRARVGELVTVELGHVEITGEHTLLGRELTLASVGNPHAVTFVDEPGEIDVANVGVSIGTHARFPDGTNVEFVAVRSRSRLDLRVWERGVGETPACGSGMVASAAVARRLELVDDKVDVGVTGGVGTVSFDSDGVAWLTGPAEYSFEGEIVL